LHPHQEPTASPRVLPTPLGTPPPRVHTTPVSLKVPGILPTCTPSSVRNCLFPLDVSSLGPRQNTVVHQLGSEPSFPTNSNISHLGIPMPAAPISCQIKPHEPSSPLTKLRQSQQIADLGILDGKVYTVDGPACNTHSQTQVQTIIRNAVLACMHNHGEATGRPIMACHTARWQFPSKNAPHCPLQNHRPPHGNVAPTGEPQVQGTVGQILHEGTWRSCSRHPRSQQKY
jgi:hypothetical protein